MSQPEQRNETALPLKYRTIVADPPWTPELGATWATRFTDKARPQKQLRHALIQANLYVGPVGISTHATGIWREVHYWTNRLDSLIAEMEEWEAMEE